MKSKLSILLTILTLALVARHVVAHEPLDWFQTRKESPRAHASNLGRLASFFAFCARRGWLPFDPTKRAERPSIDTLPPAFLSVDQCRDALKWCAAFEQRHLAWLTVAMLIGLRPQSEADTLQWSDIDLGRGFIKIASSNSKTRSHRIIDLNFNPSALSWLELAKSLGSNLAPDLPFIARRRFVRRLSTFFGFDRRPQDLLRHTAATYLFAFQQDAGKVAAFLGNSASILHRNYRGLAYPDQAARWMALSAGAIGAQAMEERSSRVQLAQEKAMPEARRAERMHYAREYRNENADKVKAQKARYRAANRVRILAERRAYYATHKNQELKAQRLRRKQLTPVSQRLRSGTGDSPHN